MPPIPVQRRATHTDDTTRKNCIYKSLKLSTQSLQRQGFNSSKGYMLNRESCVRNAIRSTFIRLLRKVGYMLGRKPKLTTNKSDRKDQREATENLIDSTQDMDALQLTAPKFLKGKAKYMYEQLAPKLQSQQFVKDVDINIVASLCVNYELLQNAYADIEENGQTYITESGQIRKNPNADILMNASKNIKSLASELGLTPASRAQLFNVEPTNNGMTLEQMQEAFGV